MEEGRIPKPKHYPGKTSGGGVELILDRFQTKVNTQMQRKFTPRDLEDPAPTAALYSRGH